ncbi:unnamed protein product, partial [Psylliodes chrysocephalus]
SENVCAPIVLKNGVAKRRSLRSRVVRFFCNRGYLLAGEKHSTCVRNKWDPAPPRCVRPTCKTIGQQINTDNLVTYPTHSKAVLHFFCKAGFTLNGPSAIYCDGSTWSNHVPTCLPANTPPKLSCDFETVDLCGWTHDLNHDFDWLRENYNTPSGSIGTGPSFDHTKGVGGDGYYMYIESSSKAQNDTARLISPVYDKMDDEVCFEFFYHMYGATIGTLRVYLKTVNQTWSSLNPQSAIFTKSGNQGDKWYRSFHHLGIVKEEFQIIIEGVRGAGYISDIAIDDVKIIPNCIDEDEITTTMDSSTYNELVPTVDTCDNRCGQTEPVTTDNYHLTCDCDDDCFNNNRCCPDYYDTCTGTTIADEFDTTNFNEDEKTEPTTNVEMSAETSPPTNKKTIDVTVATKKPTTSIYIPQNNTTMKVYPEQPIKPTTVRLLETSTERVILITTKNTPKTTPKYTRPVIHLQTPPPTTVIYRKIITTTTTNKPTYTKSDKQFDDAIDVPWPTNIDEGVYDVAQEAKEFWSDEIENSLDSPSLRNFSESNKLFSQTYVEEANSHFLILGVSLTCAIILISVVAFVVVRKYRFSKFRGIMSSNGESQSDVRYLTNSDALDLSLPDCYGELN